MDKKSQSNSAPRIRALQLSGACALAAAATALALNWQGAKPGHELETLRERPMEAAAVPAQSGLVQPDTKPAPALPGTADDEETLKDRTVLTERRQDPGQPMSMLEAFKASEDASLKNLDHSAAAYPFSAKN